MIDDAVKVIDNNAFPYVEDPQVTSIYIGASLENFYDLPTFDTLRSYTVSPKNQYFSAENGWLYNKEKTNLYDIPYAVREQVTELILPDSVTTLTDDLWGLGVLTAIDIGSVTDLSAFPLNEESLTSISAGKSNTAFASKDGVLYDKDMTTMIKMPYALARSTTDLVIPDTVTTLETDALKGLGVLTSIHIGGLTELPSSWVFNIYDDTITSLSCADSNPSYASQDGILYNKDMTILIRIPAAKAKTMTKLYIPDTVTELQPGSINELTGLTEIHIGGLTDLSMLPYQEETVVSISAGKGNARYGSKDGILYTSGLSELLYIPKGLRSEITSFVMPDTMVSAEKSSGYSDLVLKSLSIGAAYSDDWLCRYHASLDTLTVSKNNSVYQMKNGILMSKDGKVMYWMAPATALELTVLEVPDDITAIQPDIYYGHEFPKLTKIIIGAGLDRYSAETLSYYCSLFEHLRTVEVSADNPVLCSDNGLLLSKDERILYVVPAAREYQTVRIPESVETICHIQKLPKALIYCAAYGTGAFNHLQAYATQESLTVTGDLDGDKRVGVVDLVTVQKYLLNAANLTKEQYLLADMDLDGGVDVFDLALYKRMLMMDLHKLPYNWVPSKTVSLGRKTFTDTITINAPKLAYGIVRCNFSVEGMGLYYGFNDYTSAGEFTLKWSANESTTVFVDTPGSGILHIEYQWYPSGDDKTPAMTVQYEYQIFGKLSGGDDPGSDDPGTIEPASKYGAANVRAIPPTGMIGCQYTWSGLGVSFDDPTSASTIARGAAGTTATCYCTITGKMFVNGKSTITTYTYSEIVYFM